MEINEKENLFDKANIAVRVYLTASGWKEFDTEMLTNNMFFVIDPLTGQNFPIDYAYTIQSSRNLTDRITNYEKCEKKT